VKQITQAVAFMCAIASLFCSLVHTVNGIYLYSVVYLLVGAAATTVVYQLMED